MNNYNQYITEDFVKLSGLTNNTGDSTSTRIKSYFKNTFEIDNLLNTIWNDVKDHTDLSRTDFRYNILCKSLNKPTDFSISITNKDAANYLFYSLYPILEAAYNSYIVKNHNLYDTIEKQDIDFYDYMDEAFILFNTEVLKESNFSRILDGGKSNIMNNLKSMFSARIVDLAQDMKRSEATHGLADSGPVNSDFKRTVNATTDELDNIEYNPNTTKDYSEFLEKWNKCCNDVNYKFNRWSRTKKSADGKERPNRKAKILKFLVINALKSAGADSARDIYTSLYSDTSNPKQKWDGEIVGTLVTGNKELTLLGILKDYNININEIIEACRDLGVNAVLGQLKGMGSQLPDSDLKAHATALGKELADGNDILNERKI